MIEKVNARDLAYSDVKELSSPTLDKIVNSITNSSCNYFFLNKAIAGTARELILAKVEENLQKSDEKTGLLKQESENPYYNNGENQTEEAERFIEESYNLVKAFMTNKLPHKKLYIIINKYSPSLVDKIIKKLERLRYELNDGRLKNNRGLARRFSQIKILVSDPKDIYECRNSMCKECVEYINRAVNLQEKANFVETEETSLWDLSHFDNEIKEELIEDFVKKYVSSEKSKKEIQDFLLSSVSNTGELVEAATWFLERYKYKELNNKEEPCPLRIKKTLLEGMDNYRDNTISKIAEGIAKKISDKHKALSMNTKKMFDEDKDFSMNKDLKKEVVSFTYGIFDILSYKEVIVRTLVNAINNLGAENLLKGWSPREEDNPLLDVFEELKDNSYILPNENNNTYKINPILYKAFSRRLKNSIGGIYLRALETSVLTSLPPH